MLAKLAAVASLLITLMGQDTGVLRVRVTLVDAAGAATPIPRVVLLVSDNPASGEPHRIRTSNEGIVELKLKPGSYTVESDEPIGFGGKGYAWTAVVTVTAGRETLVDLTATNAEIGDAPTTTSGTSSAASADSATVLSKWRDTVVQIWTPTAHASGFLVDATGLIATNYRALGSATTVEVEITSGDNRFKVPGQVIVSERLTGTAIVRINPSVSTTMKAIDPGCGRSEWTPVTYQQIITTIAAPLLSDKDLIDGPVNRVTAQAIFADLRIERGNAGGPAFSEAGDLIGISALEEDAEGRRASEAWVVPLELACQTIAAAAKTAAGAAPASTHLPVDPVVKTTTLREDKAAKTQPPSLSSTNFDITLLTSPLAREATSQNGPKSDFGNWSEYVRRAPPVIMIRVSPQFEESFWKLLARGAASTQGMALPPLKSFSSNFLKLQAFCGDTEVLPIHPFVIEHQVPEKAGAIREGLYVFDPASLHAGCGNVRLVMFSEKEPQRADIRIIDGKLFQQVANSLQ